MIIRKKALYLNSGKGNIMIFEDWKEKSAGLSVSPTLLWEYDLTRFDWNKMRTVVVGRVIERGWPDDFYAAIRLYGEMDNFREIIKEIPVMSDRDADFVCTVFDLKKDELYCIKRKAVREAYFNLPPTEEKEHYLKNILNKD